jgi:hypothetical protein
MAAKSRGWGLVSNWISRLVIAVAIGLFTWFLGGLSWDFVRLPMINQATTPEEHLVFQDMGLILAMFIQSWGVLLVVLLGGFWAGFFQSVLFSYLYTITVHPSNVFYSFFLGYLITFTGVAWLAFTLGKRRKGDFIASSIVKSGIVIGVLSTVLVIVAFIISGRIHGLIYYSSRCANCPPYNPFNLEFEYFFFRIESAVGSSSLGQLLVVELLGKVLALFMAVKVAGLMQNLFKSRKRLLPVKSSLVILSGVISFIALVLIGFVVVKRGSFSGRYQSQQSQDSQLPTPTPTISSLGEDESACVFENLPFEEFEHIDKLVSGEVCEQKYQSWEVTFSLSHFKVKHPDYYEQDQDWAKDHFTVRDPQLGRLDIGPGFVRGLYSKGVAYSLGRKLCIVTGVGHTKNSLREYRFYQDGLGSYYVIGNTMAIVAEDNSPNIWGFSIHEDPYLSNRGEIRQEFMGSDDFLCFLRSVEFLD